MTELNGRWYEIRAVGASDITIDVDSTNFTTYSSAGTARIVSVVDTITGTPSAAAPNVLSGQFFVGTGYTNPVRFNVYKQKSGIFGFIGETKSLVSFEDTGQEPDLASNPPERVAFFDSTVEKPSVVALLAARLRPVNYATDIEKVVMSQIGNTNNFLRGYPISDSDAMTFNPITKRISRSRHR